jgi:hypothetical protein
MRNKLQKGIALSLLIWQFPLWGCKGGGEARIGGNAPYFRYQDMNTKKGSIQELKGKVVLLSFAVPWGIDCIMARDCAKVGRLEPIGRECHLSSAGNSSNNGQGIF